MKCPGLRMRVSKTHPQDQEHSNERDAHQPAPRPHDQDMSVRKFGEKTQNDYIRHVKSFSTFLGWSPAKASPEDLRRYQVHQSSAGEQPGSINSSVAALRFFFRVTLNRPDMGHHLTRVPMPEKLRVVLSKEEVAQLLD